MKIEYCHAVFREVVQMKTLSMSLCFTLSESFLFYQMFLQSKIIEIIRYENVRVATH